MKTLTTPTVKHWVIEVEDDQVAEYEAAGWVQVPEENASEETEDVRAKPRGKAINKKEVLSNG